MLDRCDGRSLEGMPPQLVRVCECMYVCCESAGGHCLSGRMDAMM